MASKIFSASRPHPTQSLILPKLRYSRVSFKRMTPYSGMVVWWCSSRICLVFRYSFKAYSFLPILKKMFPNW